MYGKPMRQYNQLDTGLYRTQNKILKAIHTPKKILVPAWYIFVCQPGSEIKHDYCTLPMNTAIHNMVNAA